jgi:Zn-dependent protease with chaperone function
MKTPTVYLLSHQPGINAFATGDHHDRAVIAVTAGALRELPLPEVTALLAHQVGFIATGDAAEPSDTALRAAIVAAGKDGGSYEHLSSQARGEAKQGEKGGNHVAFSLATQGRATNQKLAQRKIRLTPGLVFFLPFAAIICFAGLPGYLAALVIQSSLGRVGSYRGDHCAEELLGEREELMRVLGRIAAHPCGSKIFGRRGCEIAHIVFADYASKNLRTLVATHLPLPERLQALLGDRLTGEEGEHRA